MGLNGGKIGCPVRTQTTYLGKFGYYITTCAKNAYYFSKLMPK